LSELQEPASLHVNSVSVSMGESAVVLETVAVSVAVSSSFIQEDHLPHSA
jgi:hypothetical protein